MIENIKVTPIAPIHRIGGNILKIIDVNSPGFIAFGEAYFSLIEKDYTKGYKLHKRLTMNLVVPVGLVRFDFIDMEGSKRTEIIGEKNYCRLTIPNNIWFSFTGLFAPVSLILNVVDLVHDPEEVEVRSLNSDFSVK